MQGKSLICFHFINSKASNRCNKPPFVLLDEELDDDKVDEEEEEVDDAVRMEVVKGVIDEADASTVVKLSLVEVLYNGLV